MKSRTDAITGKELNPLIERWKEFNRRWQDRALRKYPLETNGTKVLSNLERKEKQRIHGAAKLKMDSFISNSATIELEAMRGAKFKRQIQMGILQELKKVGNVVSQSHSSSNVNDGENSDAIFLEHIEWLTKQYPAGKERGQMFKVSAANKGVVVAKWKKLNALKVSSSRKDEQIKELMQMMMGK